MWQWRSLYWIVCINNSGQEFQCNNHIYVLNHILYLEFTLNLHSMSSVEKIRTDEQTHLTFWAQVKFLFKIWNFEIPPSEM